MNPEIEQLKKDVAELQAQLRAFQSAPELDPNIQKTIVQLLSTSSVKTAASATQAVNEAGVATYSVMVPPTGFIRIGGFNVPYIT